MKDTLKLYQKRGFYITCEGCAVLLRHADRRCYTLFSVAQFTGILDRKERDELAEFLTDKLRKELDD